MSSSEKSGSIWILENGPLGNMLENVLFTTVWSEYPGMNIVPVFSLQAILNVNQLIDTDEDILTAFNSFCLQNRLDGLIVAIAHINTEKALEVVEQINDKGVLVTARLPSPDVDPQIDMIKTKAMLDKRKIPHMDSNEPGYNPWVARSILNILNT